MIVTFKVGVKISGLRVERGCFQGLVAGLPDAPIL
jgi:hypothetical protein